MNQTGALILGACLFIIMFGMGLSLTINDFKRVIQYPKAVITGLVNQMILLPILGVALVSLIPSTPEIAVGVMLLAACPGGTTSNLISHLAKGDVALSVTLTAFSSMITIFTLPFIAQFALNEFMSEGATIVLNIPQVMGQLIMITILPVSIGMIIKAQGPDFAAKMDKPVRTGSAIILALVIIGIIVNERLVIISYFERAGILTLLLNILSMTIGYYSARIMKLVKPQATSISIESGVQNATMAIAVATVTLGNSEFAIAPAIYGLLMFFTGFVAIKLGSKAQAQA